MKISQINENIKAIVILEKTGLVKTYYDNFDEIINKNQSRPMVKIFNPTSEKLQEMLDVINSGAEEDKNGEMVVSDVKSLIELIKIFTDLELDENDDVIERKLNSVELFRTVAVEVGRIVASYYAFMINTMIDYDSLPEELKKVNNIAKEIKPSAEKKTAKSSKKVDSK